MSDRSADHDLLLNQLADEFAERYRRGERPSLGEYLDRYPELADDLRELLPALVEMEQAKEDHQDAEPPPAAPLPPLQQLGDFRILREVGHGGMGVVYEAEQVSLGRHVALKVLPQKLLVDARTKRRFEREAKAAARLHHTNIVPVYGVGEQDGLPYYAMQFIQGQGLDTVIQELRRLQPGGRARADTPEPAGSAERAAHADFSAAAVARSLLTGAFRPAPDATTDQPRAEEDVPAAPASRLADTSALSSSSVILPGQSGDGQGPRAKKATYWQSVAQIGVQVAGALEYAHRQGVLHRDVKPSNLLLDTAGTVWVTDFGLAKAEDQENLTQTGDVLGTLRYLPPEAFEGQSEPRSDVYSLGLTLYELLALQPAFDERDRHRLIKQVTAAEPPPLDRLNSAIPRDLVTIVHKAIEREPEQRYGTAADLAADLQRFLADEPIQARRISTRERLGRWARHNRGLAASFAVIAALLLAAAGGASVAAVGFRSSATRQARLAEEREAARVEEARQRERAEASLYAARVTLAESALKAADASATELALGKCLPEAAARDWRGWEWYYLSQWLHAEKRTFTSPTPYIYAVAFSPDGRLLASAGGGNPYFGNPNHKVVPGQVLVRDFPSGRVRHVLQGHTHLILTLAFSPNGQRLATAGLDDQVRVWDTATGKEQCCFDVPSLGALGRVRLEFLADGLHLACRAAHNVRLFALETGREERAFPGQEMTVSHDGQYLAALAGQTVQVYAVATGQLVRSVPGRGMTFGPDSRRLFVVAAEDGSSLHVVDVATGQELGLLHGDGTPAQWLVVDPTGRHLAAYGEGHGWGIWETASGRLVRRFQIPGGFAPSAYADPQPSLAFSPDGTLVAAAGADNAVRVWDVVSGKERAVFVGDTTTVTGVAFAPVGQQLATAAFNGDLRIWDPQRHPRGDGFPTGVTHDRMAALAFTADGTALVTVGSRQPHGGIMTWSAQTGQLLHQKDVAMTARAAWPRTDFALSPDRRRLAAPTADDERVVALFDAVTGQQLVTFRGHTGIVGAAAFSADGRLLATAGRLAQQPLQEVKLWDVTTADEIRTLPALPATGLRGLAFSTDGRQLATGTFDGAVAIWDVASGQALQTLTGAQSAFYLAFRPDGSQLAAADYRGAAVHAWDLATGAKQFTQPGIKSVGCVAYSPDGERLAAVGYSGDVHLLDPQTGQAVLVLRTFAPPAGNIGFTPRVAFSPDGSRLAANSAHGVLSLWDGGADAITGLREVARSLRTHPEDLALLKKRAALCLRPGRWETALKEITPVLQQWPDDPEALRIRAQAHLGLRDPDQAVADLTRVLELTAEHPELLPLAAAAYHERGQSLKNAGNHDQAQQDWQQARTCYEKLLDLEPDRADYAARFADLLLASASPWTVLRPTGLQSAGGATLTLLPDGSVLAGGTRSDRDTYTLTARLRTQGITAFLLEALPHDSLPTRGPGRRGGGNFVLSEFGVEAGGKGLAWAEAMASFSQEEFPISGAIDGRRDTGWAIQPQVGQPHHALFALRSALGEDADRELTVRLQFLQAGGYNLGRFRLSVTTAPQPVLAAQLRLALAKSPVNGWVALAAAHTLHADRPAAQAALQKATGRGESSAAERVVRAWVQGRLGQDDEARTALTPALAALERNRPDDSLLPLLVRALSDALAKAPNEVVWLLPRARAQAQTGKLDGALADYTRAIDHGLKDPLAFIARGDLYTRSQQWPKAAADYSQAITPQTRDALLLAKRAEAYQQARQWQKAADDWTRVLDLLPYHVHYRDLRGQCYRALGQRQNEIAEWTELMKLDPRNFLWPQKRGVAHDFAGQFDLALADHNRAVDLASPEERWQPLHRRGVHWARRGEWRKAADDLSNLNPSSPKPWPWGVYRDQALVCLLVGDVAGYRKAAAEVDARLTGGLDPAQARWLALAFVARAGMVTDQNLPRLLEAAAQAADAHQPRLRAALLLRVGRLEEAVALFAKQPGGPEYRFLAAIASHQLGKPEEARRRLAEGTGRMEEERKKDPARTLAAWENGALYLILQRQAAALIEGKQAEPKK